MSKKFSIVKSLDESKLQEELHIYLHEQEKDPYIFLNRETIKELGRSIKIECPLHMSSNNSVVVKYYGFKVYENNDLKYGEVELR